MSDITLSALIFLPDTEPPFDQVMSQIEDACELNDMRFERIDLESELSELEQVMYGKIPLCDLLIADFSSICDDCQSPDLDIMMFASIAWLEHKKPVIIIYHGEIASTLPIGWSDYQYKIEYKTDEIKNLRKKLAKQILELSEEIVSTMRDSLEKRSKDVELSKYLVDRNIKSDDRVKVVRADKEIAEQVKMKALLRERFKKKMQDEAEKSPEELEAEESERQEKLQGLMLRSPTNPDGEQIAPEGARRVKEEIKEAIEVNGDDKIFEKMKRFHAKYSHKKKAIIVDEHGNERLDLDEETAKKMLKQQTGKIEKKQADSKESVDVIDDNLEDADELVFDDEDLEVVHDGKPIAFLIDKLTGNQLELRMSELTGGRIPENDIVIADQQVSKKHFIITRESGNAYFVIDLATANGTYINNKRINGKTRLENGDRIILAKTKKSERGVKQYIFKQTKA